MSLADFDISDYSARPISLGGEDIFAEYDNPFTTDTVRGHVWRTSMTKAKGQVIFCPGFTEFCEKYAHVAARLVTSGYDVLMIDWPGQGRSGHFGSHPEHVHLADFQTYLNAFEALLDKSDFTGKSTIFGHSMGGHLALRAAHDYPERISRVILSAPMIRPLTGPTSGVRLLGRVLCAAGQAKRRAPFQIHLPRAIARQAGPLNPLTHDEDFYDLPYQIYDEFPDMRRAVPTVGWVRAAYRSCAQTSLNANWMKSISQPVLAFLAAQEYIVSTPLAKQSLKQMPQADIHMIDNARHEILNETADIQARIWSDIHTFLGKAL